VVFRVEDASVAFGLNGLGDEGLLRAEIWLQRQDLLCTASVSVVLTATCAPSQQFAGLWPKAAFGQHDPHPFCLPSHFLDGMIIWKNHRLWLPIKSAWAHERLFAAGVVML